MVRMTSPTFCEPPLFMGRVFLTSLDSSHEQVSKMATTSGENFWPEASIVNVVEMAMRDADGVDALDCVRFRICGVAVDPRVHQNDLARGEPELEGAVSKPGDLHIGILADVYLRRIAIARNPIKSGGRTAVLLNMSRVKHMPLARTERSILLS